ncbi:hypothetical protein [Streptomyces sp. CT34]|uniref:hypothetical protein n=1 Tax=Streptomyces sp. CT34 TaxID=1553907 RepID=UPI0005BA939C|nr:hypothetical protein [Streptomyces sp. CT34]
MTTNALLAHLSGRFKARREPIATEALYYLAEHYCPAREALTRFVRNAELLTGHPEGLRFRSEATSPEREGRPDVVGEVDGLPLLMIEGKFEASLTEYQPNGYLAGLPRGGTLLFVCPGRRVVALARQLAELIPAGQRTGSFEPDSATSTHWLKLDNARHLAVIGWLDLITALRAHAGHEDPILEGELRQLEGLVQVFESGLEALTHHELACGIGDSFTKGIVATQRVVGALQGQKQITTTPRAPRWKVDPILDRYYYGSVFSVGPTTVHIGFEPASWTPDCPSPVTFWILRSSIEDADQRSHVHGAYSLTVAAINSKFGQHFDGFEFPAEELEADYWWAPIPIPPDASEQHCEAAVRDTLANLVRGLAPPDEEA